MLEEKEQIKYQEIYKVYRQNIYNYAKKIMNDSHLAEDVTQSVLLRLYSKRVLDRLENVHSFDTKKYIAKMAKNLCFTELRHRKEEVYYDLSNERALLPEPPYNMDFFDQILQDVEHSEIRETLEKLPKKYFDVINMKYFKQYEINEMADMLNIKQVTVRKRLERGRKLLKEEILKDYPEQGNK